jgi:ribosome biogenesis GTPase
MSAEPGLSAASVDGLAAWGWDAGHAATFESHAAEGLEPGRIVIEDRGSYLVRLATGEVRATISGHYRHEAAIDRTMLFPAVGDWVALGGTPDVDQRVVRGVLPRRTAIVRRAPTDHRTPEQVLGANIDAVLVMTSLNQELNLRRLERYLALAWGSGAQPVVVLSKADLASDHDAAFAAVSAVSGGAPIHVVSSVTGVGLDDVRAQLAPGRTLAIIGSSGVGKSTLVNALADELVAATGEIREDDARGRHTTSRRHLVLLPAGGLVLDTPGMRELGLVEADAGLDETFEDIDALARECRFADCLHDSEPGCAVRAAVEDGRLDAGRLASLHKLDRELDRVERTRDPRARAEERRKWRILYQSAARQARAKRGSDRP